MTDELKTGHQDRTSNGLLAATLAGLLIYTVLILVLPDKTPNRSVITDAAFALFHPLAMLLLLGAARRADDGRRRQGLMLLAVSQGFGTLNSVFWVLSSAGRMSQTAPAFELVGLAMAFFSVAGVVLLVPPRGIAGSTAVVPLIDASLLALASVSVAWAFVGAPMLASGIENDREFLGFAVIAAADLFTALFAFGAWAFPSTRLRPDSALLLTLSYGVSSWLDVLIEQDMLHGGYSSGQPLDIAFAASIVLVCVVGYFEHVPAAAPAVGHVRRVAMARLLLPFATAIAVVVPMLAQANNPVAGAARFVPWALLVLFIALVQWRYFLLERAAEVALTDRMSLERDLRLSQQFESLGRYAASVAHDMNNLLAALLAQLHLVRFLSADTRAAVATEPLTAMEKTLDTGTTLVRRLMQMSRGGDTPAVSVDLTRATRNFAITAARLLPANVHLELDLSTTPVVVLLRPGDVDQLLLNLVVNARDALPSGGHITVRIHALGAVAELEVVDDGAGIAPELVSRIFDPFFTTRPGQGGTGLGLATVQSIVTQSGGRVDVSSAPELGTRFAVRWPIIAAD